MRALLVVLVLGAVAVARVPDAAAWASCYSNRGYAPGDGAVLPPRAQIVYFDDQRWHTLPTFTATIGRVPVALAVRQVTTGSATQMVVIEVLSARTGRLRLVSHRGGDATFTVRRDAPTPTAVAATVERFFATMPHTLKTETFDGVVLRLPAGAPAIRAHVRLRRDAQAPWTELEVPVASMLHARAPGLYLGELGCSRNYSLGMLQLGVELEATVTLASGATVPITGLPARVTLPPTPPAP